MHILVLNCGSSTIKYKFFDVSKDGAKVVSNDTVEIEKGHGHAIEKILATLPHKPVAVAHRVVHGGDRYHAPVFIDENVMNVIKEMVTLAPLHNPPALEGIEAAKQLGVPQIAVFDTAFHQSMPEKAWRYAIPKKIADQHKIRRYGFHGQSHDFVTREYAKISGNEKPTLITLHLGSGASVSAIKDGKCVDTSMGTTPLEGLVMSTRGGDMDPALPLLLQKLGMPFEEVDRALWHEAGLLGLADDNDMRKLLERDDDEAKLAVEIFCYRCKKYIGAYLAALGGAQAIVFTGGIGENSPKIRQRIVEGLENIGIEIDSQKNFAGQGQISKKHSKIDIYVIPTNEELLIALETFKIIDKNNL